MSEQTQITIQPAADGSISFSIGGATLTIRPVTGLPADVYTKAEVDALLRTRVSYLESPAGEADPITAPGECVIIKTEGLDDYRLSGPDRSQFFVFSDNQPTA